VRKYLYTRAVLENGNTITIIHQGADEKEALSITEKVEGVINDTIEVYWQ
jgi:hypothetical protein